MSAGYVLGTVMTLPDAPRRRRLLTAGLALTGLFVLLRALNDYGDPRPWAVQPSDTFTVLSFIRCEKYPPSVPYLLMTLGPALCLLAVPASWWGVVGRACVVFGRAPMLYYLLHIPLVHGLALAVARPRYGDAPFMVTNEWLTGLTDFPRDWGYDLWVVYAVWAAVVCGLYLVCSWFGRLRQRKKSWWWLSYL